VGFPSSPGTLSTFARFISRHDEACLMFKKTNWTARTRRFVNRNWKFIVQTGITIFSILHK
jgi:hypothetical protein